MVCPRGATRESALDGFEHCCVPPPRRDGRNPRANSVSRLADSDRGRATTRRIIMFLLRHAAELEISSRERLAYGWTLLVAAICAATAVREPISSRQGIGGGRRIAIQHQTPVERSIALGSAAFPSWLARSVMRSL